MYREASTTFLLWKDLGLELFERSEPDISGDLTTAIFTVSIRFEIEDIKRAYRSCKAL